MRLRLAHELLDDDEGTLTEVQRSLEELGWINQHLGGVSSWRKLLALGVKPAAQAITVLDVGAGTGQMTEANAAGLRLRGLAVQTVMLDRRASHLGRGGARVAGDAFRLPFADGSVDFVTCNLFLHHFHGDAALGLLQEMARVAKAAVLVNDLERAWLPYLAILALSPRFSRITRHDGPRSVRQAYTAGELTELARQAGARRFEVMRLWPYRLGLIWRLNEL